MKNTILKRLFIILSGLILFFQPVFALQQNQNIITYINLNEKALFDIEIILEEESIILLPFKQLAEIFEVEIKQNHETKEIFFKTKDGKSGKIGLNYIFFDENKISQNKNFYQKECLMENIRDEIFCNEKDLSIIFNAEIKTDKNDLSISANTKQDLFLLRGIENNNSNNTEKITAYKNILAPERNKNIHLESVAINNNTVSNTISQYLISGKDKNIFFNNNTQLLLKGKAYEGDFSIDLNSYNYKGELFSFTGLGFQYRNKLKNLEYEIGKVRGIKDENYTIGNQMIGY